MQIGPDCTVGRVTIRHRVGILPNRLRSETHSLFTKHRGLLEPSEVAVAHYNWGVAYADQGNFGQAIMELTLAIQNEPGWVMPFFTLGVIYGNQGELDRAIQAWERATQLDADFAKAHYNLAVAYAHNAEKTLSIAALREAIRTDAAALAAAKTEPAFDLIRNTQEYQELEQGSRPKQ